MLSFFVPGVGQIYNGEFLRGIFWLIVKPGFWLGTGVRSAGSAIWWPPGPPTGCAVRLIAAQPSRTSLS